MITISSNIDDVIATVDDIAMNQIPFALVMAINNAFGGKTFTTAGPVHRHIVENTYQRAFDVKDQRFPRQTFTVDWMPTRGPELKAFKQGNAVLMLRFYDRMGRGSKSSAAPYLATQATGGVKRSLRGGNVAIPVQPEKVRTSTGKVADKNRPRRVAGGKAFRMRGKGGKELIVSRAGKTSGGLKKGDLRIHYVLQRSAKIQKTFDFHDDVAMVFAQEFPALMRNSLNRAMRSRRR